MNPVIFSIGRLEIRWYSFLILVAVFIGFILAIREGKKKGIDSDVIFDLGFYTVVFGIVGARLYYVLFNLDYVRNNILEVFKIWNGGLAIHGGILLGLITIIIFAKVRKIKILKLTDIVVTSLILGQAIGRWGNFFNSEAHGPVTTLNNLRSLRIIPSFVIKGMKIDGVYYHPTFYYECLWCLLGFIIIILIRWFYKNIKDGHITCIYLMWYSIGRFFIESLRTDSLMLGKYKMAQVISIVIFVISFIAFIVILCKNPKRKEDIIVEETVKEKKKTNGEKASRKTKSKKS